jgi:hypothetical protein
VEAGFAEKVGHRYQFKGQKPVFEKAINKAPEKFFTDDVLKGLEDYVSQRFKYTSNVAEEVDTVEDDDDAE